MGGCIFYYKERIFGGGYGSGFFVKIREASKEFMPDSESDSPYKGMKPMLPAIILERQSLCACQYLPLVAIRSIA